MKTKKRKKGYTLMELLVYLSLLSLVIVAIFNLYFLSQKIYVKSNKNILSQNQMINASLYIGDKVESSSVQSILIQNNKINIKDLKDSYEIYKERDNLKIHFNKDKRDDYIIKGNVCEFKCDLKGDLVYFNLTDKDGNFEKRCLRVKNNHYKEEKDTKYIDEELIKSKVEDGRELSEKKRICNS